MASGPAVTQRAIAPGCLMTPHAGSEVRDLWARRSELPPIPAPSQGRDQWRRPTVLFHASAIALNAVTERRRNRGRQQTTMSFAERAGNLPEERRDAGPMLDDPPHGQPDRPGEDREEQRPVRA
jgi:hypothetical protein